MHPKSLTPLSALTALCLFTLPLAGMDAAAQLSVAGNWTGALDVQGASLRIVFTITHDAETGWAATMASPDQGAFDIPVNSVVVDSASVTVSVAAIGGEYSGTLSDDGTAIAGTWSQAGMTFTLDLERSEEAFDPKRPQDPELPFPYEAADVSFPSADDGVTLAGTLTTPSGGPPSHAAVLISGSGPQDRDSEIFGHRPFLVLSDHLTRRGIAVLRFDDRGVGESTGDRNTATTEDIADDVRGALAFLGTHPAIGEASVGLIGHSEGGMVAPMVAARSDAADWVVLIAAPGVTGEEIILAQSRTLTEYTLRSQGESPESVAEKTQTIVGRQQRIFDAVKRDTDPESRAATLKLLIDEQLRQTGQFTDDEGRSQVVEAQIKQVNSPWFRFFLTYDPRPALREVTVPVLAVGGSKDMQVDSRVNLSEVEAALRAGGNADVTAMELDGLNHLLQTADTGHVAEYGAIEETMAPSAMETIAGWILNR